MLVEKEPFCGSGSIFFGGEADQKTIELLGAR